MADDDYEPPAFDPVPGRPRFDGWTPQKQVAFIEALADTGCIDHACARVRMSRASVYELRRKPGARPFRDAWDAALDYALHLVEPAAIVRSVRGTPRPIFYKGEQVGEWRHFDERLTMFLLRTRRPGRYGKWRDDAVPDMDEDAFYPPDESALRLEYNLDEIRDGVGDDGEDEAAAEDEDDADSTGEDPGAREAGDPPANENAAEPPARPAAPPEAPAAAPSARPPAPGAPGGR